jgi:hypothetical protein
MPGRVVVAKITATVTQKALLKIYDNGDIEYIEERELLDVDNIEVISEDYVQSEF